MFNNFFTVELSAVYLDVLKDRLYTWKGTGVHRRSAQTVIFTLTDYLVRMMAPILSFLAEESYGYMKGEKKASVFLLDFPTAPEAWNKPAIQEKFEILLKVRGDSQKILETLRSQKTIGASLEAKVTVKADDKTLSVLKDFHGKGGLSSDLREFFIVSDVELLSGSFEVTSFLRRSTQLFLKELLVFAMTSPPIIYPIRFRGFYVLILRIFISTAQQENKRVALLGEINSVSATKLKPKLTHTAPSSARWLFRLSVFLKRCKLSFNISSPFVHLVPPLNMSTACFRHKVGLE